MIPGIPCGTIPLVFTEKARPGINPDCWLTDIMKITQRRYGRYVDKLKVGAISMTIIIDVNTAKLLCQTGENNAHGITEALVRQSMYTYRFRR